MSTIAHIKNNISDIVLGNKNVLTKMNNINSVPKQNKCVINKEYFSIIAANITDPIHDISTCASGNQKKKKIQAHLELLH